MQQFRNPDGTYDGVAMLAAMSGLSVAAVKWTADRYKTLLIEEGRDKAEAKRIVELEAKTRPWEDQDA